MFVSNCLRAMQCKLNMQNCMFYTNVMISDNGLYDLIKPCSVYARVKYAFTKRTYL